MHMIYFRSGDSMMSVLLISGRQMASVFQKNLIGICEPQINTSAAPINTYVNTHTHVCFTLLPLFLYQVNVLIRPEALTKPSQKACAKH